MSSPDTTLVEGIDYYIENGRWVFTATHHRKRGYCCKNICRNCPFGNSPADRDKATNESTHHTSRDAQ